ncbi:MAG: hypothetical protein CXT73_00750 [Methanobacteriota archaeon]|jgi:hypothetical protein|nr:MAG: hypothetical protein CXT73_00750 [Euryarchaeota archaeon]
MNYYDFDLKKQVVFNYAETPLPAGHFLKKFLIEFQIEKFETIKTGSTKLDLGKVTIPQKTVIHDLNNDKFYKIYVGYSNDTWELNNKFYNTAYFPNNIISTHLNKKNNWWILESTRVPGEDVYNYLLNETRMTFSMDEYLDAMLHTMKFFSKEGKRIWDKDRPEGKYLSIGEVNWIARNNMFYDSITNQFTKVDHEPLINWVGKQSYMNDAIRSFIALFGNLMGLRDHKHIMNYIADGKNILKRIEYCIDFVETEIFD